MNDLKCIVTLLVIFADSSQQNIEFIKLQLHSATPVVLGLPWLQQVNPRISWAKMHIEHMAPHLSLVMTPLSIDVVATINSTSEPMPKKPSAQSITIEVYEAEDFINKACKEGVTLFTCVITNPTLMRTASTVHNTPSTSTLPDSIPLKEHQDLTQHLPEQPML